MPNVYIQNPNGSIQLGLGPRNYRVEIPPLPNNLRHINRSIGNVWPDLIGSLETSRSNLRSLDKDSLIRYIIYTYYGAKRFSKAPTNINSRIGGRNSRWSRLSMNPRKTPNSLWTSLHQRDKNNLLNIAKDPYLVW